MLTIVETYDNGTVRVRSSYPGRKARRKNFFILDREDYEKLKDTYWYKHTNGYFRTKREQKEVWLQRELVKINGFSYKGKVIIRFKDKDKSNLTRENLIIALPEIGQKFSLKQFLKNDLLTTIKHLKINNKEATNYD